MGLIFDTHAHYDDQAFDKDREELLSGLLGQGVGAVVNASAAARNMPRILELTREYDFLYGGAGLHPCETYGCGDNMDQPVMKVPAWVRAVCAGGLEEEHRNVPQETLLSRGKFIGSGIGSSLWLEARLGQEEADGLESDSNRDQTEKVFGQSDGGKLAGLESGSKSVRSDVSLDKEQADGLGIKGKNENGGFRSGKQLAGAGDWNQGCLKKVLAAYDPAERITRDWIAGEREMQLTRAMLADPKILAVGEIGLDYHYEDTRKEVQQEWFARQIALAREMHLPIIVHSRDAAADTLDMVRSEKAEEAGGIIHCFSYSKEIAAQYLDMGFMLGIGGVVTYKNAKKVKEVVCYMPLEHIVLETDCPYLCPEPFRGNRNDSSMIRYIVQVIARLKGVSEEEVILVTEANARKVYQLA